MHTEYKLHSRQAYIAPFSLYVDADADADQMQRHLIESSTGFNTLTFSNTIYYPHR